MMGKALKAEVQGIGWPIPATAPSTLAILDLLEFCHRNVASPIQRFYHKFFGHYHFTFDLEEGQEEFRSDVNRILRRNGIAYKLSQNGKIARILSPVLQELVTPALPTTGDPDLDEMLKLARTKFLDPDLQVRRESLEKLWKAFERLKTVIPGKDKKQSVDAILDRAASEPALRDTFANEARELTRIGNTFQIRHSETNQIRLNEGKHVDYLFHRLFSFIQLLLNSIR